MTETHQVIKIGGKPAQEREHLAQGRSTIVKLQEAGLEIFRRDGYYKASIDQIAELAGVSRASFYVYFSNKEDLLSALYAEFIRDFTRVAESLESLLPPYRAAAQKLRGWLDRFYDLYLPNVELVEALPLAYRENADFRRMGLANLEIMVAPWIRRITEADPSIDAQRARTHAVFLVSMVERSAYQQIRGTFGIDRDELLDELTELILAAVIGLRSSRKARQRSS
jgi:TetR/AcrR family transcriptional regulator, ethionamide resistance regulator